MEDNIIIVDPDKFRAKKHKLISEGISNLQIVSDFDKTITKASGATTYGLLEQSKLLSQEYHEKVSVLYNKFYPIEIDQTLTIAEKIPHMVEWYNSANQLLVDEKINISLFDEMIKRSNMKLREFTPEFLQTAELSDIPVLIFSAGIGELIEHIFTYFEGRVHKNVHVVSNRLSMDEQGVIVGFKDPLIHVFNKNEVAVSHDTGANWFKSVAHRKNMILLGDSPGDIGMATGLKNPGEIIKIGFLNYNVEKLLPAYKQLWDVIILNDGTFHFPLNLLQQIINQTT
jgi:5'-nucleotidase